MNEAFSVLSDVEGKHAYDRGLLARANRAARTPSAGARPPTARGQAGGRGARGDRMRGRASPHLQVSDKILRFKQSARARALAVDREQSAMQSRNQQIKTRQKTKQREEVAKSRLAEAMLAVGRPQLAVGRPQCTPPEHVLRPLPGPRRPPRGGSARRRMPVYRDSPFAKDSRPSTHRVKGAATQRPRPPTRPAPRRTPLYY